MTRRATVNFDADTSGKFIQHVKATLVQSEFINFRLEDGDYVIEEV